jgi:hypothetical protein
MPTFCQSIPVLAQVPKLGRLGADNYWVFHGCDGAGLMNDCMGGTTYVEQFGPYSTEQLPLTMHTYVLGRLGIALHSAIRSSWYQ